MVVADPTHEAVIAAGGFERGGHLYQACARRRGQQLPGALGRYRALETGEHGEGVAGEHGHPHASNPHCELRKVEDLAALIAQFVLFIGLVVDHVAGNGQDVESYRPREHPARRVRQRRPVEGESGGFLPHRMDLLSQLVDAFAAGSRSCLVRGNDELAQARLVVERLQHGHANHGGAVGVGHYPFADVDQVLAVDFGDDQRHVGVHPPGLRIVDHYRAGTRHDRRPLVRGSRPHAEQRDVQACVVSHRHIFDRYPVQDLAGGAFRCEEAQAADGQLPFLQYPTHHGAHLPGRTVNPD